MENTFGQKLKRWREAAHVSQAELARRMDVSPTWVSNLERDFSPSAKDGKPQPSIETCDKIARALGVRVAEVRLAAGYAPKGNQADTIEEALDSALYFDRKGLSELDRATLRPLLEVADREVERLTSQQAPTKLTRTPTSTTRSPVRKRDDIDEAVDMALTFGGKPVSEKDRQTVREIIERRIRKEVEKELGEESDESP